MAYIGVGPNVNLTAPGPIGGTSPDIAAFTNLTISGTVGIGGAPTYNFDSVKTITGGTFRAGISSRGIIQSDVTARGDNFLSSLSTATGTYNKIIGYQSQQGSHAGTITSQIGFQADASLIGGTSNYGFYGNIPAAAGRWNFYANGTADNFFAGNVLHNDATSSQAMFKDCGLVFLDKGNSSTTTQTLDYTAGSHQKITVTGAHSIATSNWPPTGNLGEILLEMVNGAAFAITWPTVNWVKSDGTSTTSFASNGVTLQAAGTDWILLWSRDAGTTIYGKVMR